jgi:hypothetical protein
MAASSPSIGGRSSAAGRSKPNVWSVLVQDVPQLVYALALRTPERGRARVSLLVIDEAGNVRSEHVAHEGPAGVRDLHLGQRDARTFIVHVRR